MKFINRISGLIKDNAGFSLVELGTVIIIGGLMMVPIYSLLYYVTDLKPTEKRMEVIQEALAEHLRVTGTLPCPADPTLDIDSNTEAYKGIYDTTNNTCKGLTATGNTYVGAVPVYNLKVAVDCASNDGEVPIAASVEQALKDGLYSISEVFGGQNSKTDVSGNAVESERADGIKCVPNEYVLNEYGQKFVYAVSADMLGVNGDKPDIFSPSIGSIEIQNETGTAIDSNRLYALVSFGDDGLGGYNRAGNQISTCSGGLEQENCDGDNVFLASAENLTNDYYYDDRLEYGIAAFMQEDSSWRWAKGSSTVSDNIALNNNTVLMVGSVDSSETGVNDVDDNDSLIVNRGSMKIEGNLNLYAVSHNDDAGTQTVSGGTLETTSDISSNIYNTFDTTKAPQFCYDNAISDACQNAWNGGDSVTLVTSCHLVNVNTVVTQAKRNKYIPKSGCENRYDREKWTYEVKENSDGKLSLYLKEYEEKEVGYDDGSCESDKDDEEYNEVIYTSDLGTKYEIASYSDSYDYTDVNGYTITKSINHDVVSYYQCGEFEEDYQPEEVLGYCDGDQAGYSYSYGCCNPSTDENCCPKATFEGGAAQCYNVWFGGVDNVGTTNTNTNSNSNSNSNSNRNRNRNSCSGVDDTGDCCDPSDGFCCPTSVYDAGGNCYLYWD